MKGLVQQNLLMKKLTKEYSVIAEFSIIPIGTEKTSVSPYVSDAIKALEKVENLEFKVTPMGTILEAESLTTIFQAVKSTHQTIFNKGAKRVISTLRIDDRRDKHRTMQDKVEALETQREPA
ncbi:MAG: MTH1187 family thiamine-binding protein [Candidatus Bathyarchaeota archaeon]